MTGEFFERTYDAVTDGANAMKQIVKLYDSQNPISRRTKRQFAELSNTAAGEVTRDRKSPLSVRLGVHLLLVQRLCNAAIKERRADELREALRSLFFVGVLIGRGGRGRPEFRLVGYEFAALCAADLRVPPAVRAEVRSQIAELQKSSEPGDFRIVFGVGRDEIVELVKLGNRGSKFDAAPILPPLSEVPTEPATTTLLAAAAERQSVAAQATRELTSYDLSEVNLRIRNIRMSSLRGSPLETTFSFERNGHPVSTLIFGENGSGKSTISDAIEFALQGRIGRSANFTSPLLPALQSFASSSAPTAIAELSDGSSVERSIKLSRSGEALPAPSGVRPGFRLAPISLKRSDLLKFLDTQALERGAILLDYFPADAESLALRPEEEARRLDAEATELRIRRSAVATELARLLGVERSRVEQANTFRRILRDQVMGGRTQKEFEEDNGWDEIDDNLKELIYRIQATQNSLSRIKGRRRAIEEVLNPVIHKDQIENLRAALDEVGDEVSGAFKAVAREHQVKRIDVIFGESGPLSLDLLVHLADGTLCFPQQVFSEAYRDLVSLLFFASVARKASERGQAKVLILDDVLQSVDSGIRRSFVSYLLEHFADWQLIFTVHDRLWFDQLKDMFDAFGHEHKSVRIKSWSYHGGPAFSDPSADALIQDLTALMPSGEPRTISVLAGQALEVICDQLTWRLRLRVGRKEGDKYTLADLWPVVRERFENTRADAVARSVASHRSLRNMVAHADPVSQGLTPSEARDFANSVLNMYAAVKCRACGSWVRGEASPKCNCGATRI